MYEPPTSKKKNIMGKQNLSKLRTSLVLDYRAKYHKACGLRYIVIFFRPVQRMASERLTLWLVGEIIVLAIWQRNWAVCTVWHNAPCAGLSWLSGLGSSIHHGHCRWILIQLSWVRNMVLSFNYNEPIVSLSEGNLYASGEIGKVDLAKAAKYFTKAAEKG